MGRIEHAARAALPILAELRDSLRRPPLATLDAVERLRRAALFAGAPAQSEAGDGQTPDAARVAPARTTSPTDIAERGDWTLDSLREEALLCAECGHLAKSRRNVVFGAGNPEAELMFIGEAPGATEDARGEPFVGAAGELLDKIIAAMELQRSDVYIANILKCRPDMPPGEPGNRKPRPDEMATCIPWLTKQIELVGPKVIVALGLTAAEGLLGVEGPLGPLRGRWHDYKGTPVKVTYHPSHLLRTQSNAEKRKTWEDMLDVMGRLGMPISEKQRGYFARSA